MNALPDCPAVSKVEPAKIRDDGIRSIMTSRARIAANRLRIIGGSWRSRLIVFPDTEGLRPTPDRVRETLFNWLGQDLTGRRCLDLFAGAGALGFEALSRGAAEVVMVERSATAFRSLQDNAAKLGARDLRLIRGDALEFLASAGRSDTAGVASFDIVFIDPPYASGLVPQVLARVAPLVSPGGRAYVEGAAAMDAPAPWRTIRRDRAGAVHYQLMERGTA